MSDPIYRGEAILLNWNDNKSGRKIVLQIEKDAPGAHPFDGLDGERFAVVIVGPLASDEHSVAPGRGKAAGGKTVSEPDQLDAAFPLETAPAVGNSKPKRRWQDMPASQRAALALQSEQFRTYVCGMVETVPDEIEADECLKARLGIVSKSDLDRNQQKAAAFDRMYGNFQATVQARGHGVI